MNRKLLALAVAAACSLPLVAQAAPTIYGQLNLSLDKVDLESTDGDLVTPGLQPADYFEVNSNSSRLGVMGEEALGDGLSAVYKVEGVVDGAGDIGYDWNSRDRFLGLKGNFGTVKLGNYDSPLKSSQGSVDQFNDMRYADMGNFLSGENRMANLIGYESPKFADAVTVKLALQPGESNANDGIAEAMSASVAYDANGLYLALAMDNEASGGAYDATTARDAIRVTATYTMDALQLGALYQTSEASDEVLGTKDDQDALLVSAAFTMGKNVIKGQLVMANDEFAPGVEVDTQVIELGFDHNFTQMTKAYAQVGMANYDAGSGTDADDTVVSVGMLTKF